MDDRDTSENSQIDRWNQREGRIISQCTIVKNRSQDELFGLILREIDLFETVGREPRWSVYEKVCPEHCSDWQDIKRFRAGKAAYELAPITIPGYRILSEIGRGGMGIVYRARHRDRGVIVALKVLLPSDQHTPQYLARLKAEFRNVRELSHPNIARVFALNWDGPTPFIAMEYIRGSNIVSHLHRHATDPRFPLDRFLHSAIQCAQGIHALHECGFLHGDITASNVLVEAKTNRVVLVDFGMSINLNSALEVRTRLHGGTGAYRAPEVLNFEELTFAVDWYAFGALLIAMACGRSSLSQPLCIPNTLASRVPGPIYELICNLLSKSPSSRPKGDEILALLESLSANYAASHDRAVQPTGQTCLIGRESEIAELRNAFTQVLLGKSAKVLVEGDPGTGKSTLVRTFLHECQSSGRAIVFSGKCSFSETGSYKALDNILVEIRRHLERLPSDAIAQVLPKDVGALLEVFESQAFCQIAAFEDAASHQKAIGRKAPDLQDIRDRGFCSMRDLLYRLSDFHLRHDRILILAVDDLQWGDADSAALLNALFDGIDQPTLLWIGCYRTSGKQTDFVRSISTPHPAIHESLIRLAPLSDESIRELADLLLSLRGRDSPFLDDAAQTQLIDRIVQQCCGLPLLVNHFVVGIESFTDLLGTPSITDVQWHAIQRLSSSSRRIIEVLALAGQPLHITDIAVTARVGRTDFLKCERELKAGYWISQAEGTSRESLEVYHDSISESVRAKLSADKQQAYFARLAVQLVASRSHYPDVFKATIHEQAGKLKRAAAFYVDAARVAFKNLLFHQAADNYGLALRLNCDHVAERFELLRDRAVSLANIGQGKAAADSYQQAAESTIDESQALKLIWRAAEQLLISGHMKEGRQLFRRVLAKVEIPYPATARRALLSIIVNRNRLKFRRRRVFPVNSELIPPFVLTKVDVCWAATGFSTTDPIRGAAFQSKSLILALRAREPYRVARAMAAEAANVATLGVHSRYRVNQLLSEAKEWVEHIRDMGEQSHAKGIGVLADGIAHYMWGMWSDARNLCDQASELFSNECRSIGVAWDRDTARLFSLWCCVHQGNFAELAARFPAQLKDAENRKDLYAEAFLKSYISTVLKLAQDDPKTAREELDDAASKWVKEEFHVQTHNFVLSHANIELYRGEYRSAFEYLTKIWKEYVRSKLIRVQVIQGELRYLRATAAASMLPDLSHRRLVRTVLADARRLERTATYNGRAKAEVLRAAVDQHLSRSDAAISRLEAASKLFNANGVYMHAHALSARRRRAQLMGSVAGNHELDLVDREMREVGIVSPERFANACIPVMTIVK